METTEQLLGLRAHITDDVGGRSLCSDEACGLAGIDDSDIRIVGGVLVGKSLLVGSATVPRLGEGIDQGTATPPSGPRLRRALSNTSVYTVSALPAAISRSRA